MKLEREKEREKESEESRLIQRLTMKGKEEIQVESCINKIDATRMRRNK